MEPSRFSTSSLNPVIAGCLSALLPGLGQFYNGQWGKGALFFFGMLVVGGGFVSSGGFDRLDPTLRVREVPEDLAQLLLLALLLLALALWSVFDAVRVARSRAAG